MKKNLVNKKVVSSIGIGIMAFVTATSSTLTVLAEENAEQPAPEPAPVVETNTNDKTEAPSENQAVVDNVSNAQTEVNNAQEAVNKAQETADANDNITGIQDALNAAQEALGNKEDGTGLIGDLDALENANAEVGNKNKDLDDQLKDEDGFVQEQVDTVNTSSQEVIDAVDRLTDENVKEIEDAADTAVEDAKKEYENAEAAKEAEDQVRDIRDSATSEDGLLGTVDKAENKFDKAEDALNTVKDQIDRIENAQLNANDAADTAKAAEDKIKEDAAGVEELNMAVETAKVAQTTLKNTLDEAETLKKQIEEGLGDVETGDQKELKGLIDQLTTLESLNSIELENYIASIAKFADVKIAGDTEETTVGALVNGYIDKYQYALKKHMEALDGLAAKIDSLQMKEDSTTKAALENAKEAFEKAKEYEAGCLEACEEVNGIITAINGVQNAQDDLDAAKNADYEKIFEELEKLEEDAKTKYEDWQENKLDTRKKDDYYKVMDKIARERIMYILLKEGTVKDPSKIEFIAEKHGVIDENNYFAVSYPIYDENGDEIGTQTEYFDYSEDVRPDKIDVYKKDLLCQESGLGKDELAIQVNNGKPEYKVQIGNEEFTLDDTIQVEITDKGYKIKNAVEKVTYYFQGPTRGIDYTVVVETRYGQKTTYSCGLSTGGTLAGASPIIVDGKILGVRFANKEYNTIVEPQKTTTSDDVTFRKGVILDFTSKVDENRGLSNDAYKKDLNDYQTQVSKAEDILKRAKETLETSVSNREDNDELKSAVSEYLQDTAKGSNDVLGKADAENEVVTTNWKTSNTVKKNVDKAYLGIAGAVTSLLSVNAKEANIADYSDLTDAVENHVAAAEKLKSDELSRLRTAVGKLTAIAFPFRYNTPSTTPGGTTPGGTPGGTTGGGTGGTTGGGAGGTTGGGTGGAGGGAADAAVPAAAPVVTIPTTAVPLAGPAVADAEEAEDGAAGLTTLEDEVTPLAGPEKKEDAAGLADFPIPDINITAEARQMSWLWLLIVALLGATGIEMYRRHQKKQQEEANIEN